MRNVVLFCGLFASSLLPGLHAGTVVFLNDAPEARGKLTLDASAIQLEGSSKSTLGFADVLEANFAETPFHLEYFSTTPELNKLPPDWKVQDLGAIKILGSTTCKAGVITFTGGGENLRDGEHRSFAGRPWSGNGQFTVHLRSVDSRGGDSQLGILLRDGLEPNQPFFGLSSLRNDGGVFVYGNKSDPYASRGGFPFELPIWLRLTRFGSAMAGATSRDGKTWDNCGIFQARLSPTPYAGIFFNSGNAMVEGKGEVDQITFAPTPAASQVVPPGVLLRSGSFIAGMFNPIDFRPEDADPKGEFIRNGKKISILASQIAFAVLQPTPRANFISMGAEAGLIMKNGDFLNGNFEMINDGSVRLSSVALGVVSYPIADANVCVVGPLKSQDAPYEVRLTDGSIIRANGFSVADNQLAITEISGLTLPVLPEEIAQFRAGSARAQNLLELPWNVVATQANAKSVAVPEIPSWAGPNQEQILVVPTETQINFPLPGKFRAVALRIALASDAPASAQATVRILADGKELGRTPAFRAGDPPRFVQIALKSTSNLSFVAESATPGIRILFVDPVALRENTL